MFFFFAGGLQQQVRQVIKSGAGKCISCGSAADLVEYEKVLKVFMVPVWRWAGKEALMYCNNCNLFYPPPQSFTDQVISRDSKCRYCDGVVKPGFNYCPFCSAKTL